MRRYAILFAVISLLASCNRVLPKHEHLKLLSTISRTRVKKTGNGDLDGAIEDYTQSNQR